MNNSALPYWLTFAVLLVALYGGYKMYQVENARPTGGAVEGRLPPLEDFELTDQDGRTFRSVDMKGKVWVASFFYSNCPYSCAQLNANIRYLTQQPELQDVAWVSITVDPEKDKQPVLAEYAKSLRADTTRWRFCRHDDFEYVKRLSEDVLRVGGVNYKGHNDYVVVVDRNGQIAGMFNGYSTESLEKGVALLKKILAEPAAPAIEPTDAEPTATDPPASEAA